MDQDALRLVPLSSDAPALPITLCLAIRPKYDPAAGWFVPLYQTPDANVFLGGICDGRQDVKEWLEIWVQHVPTLNADLEGNPLLNNAFLDHKWRERAAVFQELDPRSVWVGPWQDRHSSPLYFAPDSGTMVVPCDPPLGEAGRWQLCLDDSLLRRSGLPVYSESRARYLYLPQRGADRPFVALSAGGPSHSRVTVPNAALGFLENWVPFNPGCGLMLVRRFHPLLLRHFTRILEGYGWPGSGQGTDKIQFTPTYAPFQEGGYLQNNHGLLFSGRRGRSGRILECYLLKVLLFREVVAAVAHVVRKEGRPFLNLTADDFRVRLVSHKGRLPRFWDFDLQLARTSESVAVEVDAKRARFFRTLGPLNLSKYQPRQLSKLRQGRGDLRLRKVRPETEGWVVCEGTLAGVELSGLESSDLLRIDIPFHSERLVMHARALREDTLAQLEIRFESLPQPISPAGLDRLTAMEGVPIPEVSFAVHPTASSPTDLYSLGVIGVELLLDDQKVGLAVALDEYLSLAQAIAGAGDAKVPLPQRRAKVLEAEPRFWKSLGPQNLCREELTVEAARTLFPPELWWGYFDILVRMIPGTVPDSWARDLGDVNPFALETCFLEPLAELDTLVERIRSVLFMDWTSNHEAWNVLNQLS